MKFLFLAGRIRALQSRLLSSAQVERMVMAETVEDAFRVFSELQYAEYLFPDTKVDDFEKIIDQGLLETKELIVSGTENAVEFDILWKPFDVNNFKRALKEKLVDDANEIENFSAENGYEILGSITKEALEKAVFENEFSAGIPSEFVEATQKADELFAETKNFQLVEFLFDNALYVYLNRLSKELKSDFLKKVVVWQIDRANLKAMIRAKALDQPTTDEMYLSGGSMDLAVFKSDITLDSVTAFLFENNFMHLAMKLKGQTFESFQDLLLEMERLIEAETTAFLLEADEDDLGSIIIPMVYFLKRVKNARVLKFVMYAKIYNLDPERIYETIKHF
ncbi:hypothetical protein CSB37_03125 [bacterium DOLZORAL124_38_8]|nr:MAG: hypothetical protein CSB37_03125 [bacterium DOLZORAL124_38_8]